MKVLFILPTLSGGGAERVVNQLVEKFHAEGSKDLQVAIVSLLETGGAEDKQYPIFYLGCSRVIRSLRPLYKLLQQYQPAVVVSTLKHVTMLASLLRLISLHRFKHVARVANTYSKEMESIAPLKKRVVWSLIHLSNKLVDRFICVSEGVKHDLGEYFSVKDARCKVILNPVDLPRIRRLADAAEPNVGASRGSPVILAVGRLSKQKDYFTLIDAVAELAVVNGFRLIILGDGDMRSAIEQRIVQRGLEHNILILGFVDNPYPYYKLADIFVLSSLYEGLPNVLLEALAFDLPVVSTDCNFGPREIITSDRLGVLVPVRDPVRLCHAIQAQLKVGKDSGRSQYVQERFSLDSVANQYKQVFFDV